MPRSYKERPRAVRMRQLLQKRLLRRRRCRNNGPNRPNFWWVHHRFVAAPTSTVKTPRVLLKQRATRMTRVVRARSLTREKRLQSPPLSVPIRQREIPVAQREPAGIRLQASEQKKLWVCSYLQRKLLTTWYPLRLPFTTITTPCLPMHSSTTWTSRVAQGCL